MFADFNPTSILRMTGVQICPYVTNMVVSDDLISNVSSFLDQLFVFASN